MANFLKIDSLVGECADALHANQIEVHSWSWGETNQAAVLSGGGLSAGKVSMSDFNVMMSTNKASVDLFLSCASGRHFKTAELFVTALEDGGKQADFLIVKMSDVMVSSYNVSGAGDRPMESISFAFSKFEVSYLPRDPKTGALAAPLKAGWDLGVAKAV